ncbi:LysE family transporter [Cesiribacter sp. SM1]|uniref:LysE family transporter n=1 Tax=Cesiribacter sp. SM1 TaxID=2861196 RepID=UPI001CD6984A|nr:LysE family transporter [Cesiribacter sp. SM1]
MFESFELSALLISIIAGLFLGVPSGPALFFVLDTCLKESKTAALKVYGGLMGSKLLYIALALLANDFISTHQKLESVFYLIASFLLMLWGIVIIIKSSQNNDKKREFNHGSFYRNGFIVGLSNPVIPFVYLTFLQFIKIYARDVNTFKYILNIAIMEAVSFLVLAGMASVLISGGRIIQNHWNKLVRLMGIFLFCAGSYQVYQLIDFKTGGGIGIKSNENVLEKQLEKVEEETKSQPPN